MAELELAWRQDAASAWRRTYAEACEGRRWLAAIMASIESSAKSLFFTLVWLAVILLMLPIVLGLAGIIWKHRRQLLG